MTIAGHSPPITPWWYSIAVVTHLERSEAKVSETRRDASRERKTREERTDWKCMNAAATTQMSDEQSTGGKRERESEFERTQKGKGREPGARMDARKI